METESYKIYILGNKLFKFDPSIKYTIHENSSYYGIKFIIENEGNDTYNKDALYDIIYHYNGWERLFINDKKGWKDVPFHEGTFYLLPKGIEVIQL